MSTCVFSNCPAPEAGPNGRCLSCGSLLLGERVRNRYQIREVVSKSKYSISYLSVDTNQGDAERILKELQPVSEGEPDSYSTTRAVAERLFEREARVLLTLQHRGIPRLFSTFELNGYWYLVQEYIAGQTLLDWLDANQNMIGEREARRILMELATILAYLHSRVPPVVHRDIKPQNLMLAADDGRLLLINFAAVSQVNPAGERAGTIIGSAGYAPPEQLIGQAVPQSDLYAAGATMLRLLTGLHPSRLFNPVEQRFIWEGRVKVTPTFAEIINGLLVYEVAKRTSSAGELIAQLEILRPLSN
jgi:serine/threonine protein kinase